MAMYILKQRVPLGRGRPSSYRPLGSPRYGPWQRVCPYATQGEAADHMRKLNTHPLLVAIFHKGKRVAGGEAPV